VTGSVRAELGAAVVLAVYLAPIAHAVWLRGRDAILNLFAADAFYYLTIAKRTPLGTFATFDGIAPTNGFHPLWQYVLVFLNDYVGGDKDAFVWAVFLMNAAVAGVALYLLARTAYERHRNLPLVGLFLVPGVFHALAWERSLYAISSWKVINGMETAASLLVMALVVVRLARIAGPERAAQWTEDDFAALGGLAALLVLARLDNALLLFTLPLYLIRTRRPRDAAYLLGIPSAVLLLYVAANLAAGLPALPVSGTSKTGFHLFGTVRVVVDSLLAPVVDVFGTSVSEGLRFRSRVLGLLALVCAGTLAVAVAPTLRALTRRRVDAPDLDPFVPLLLFLLLRISYYLVFVRLSHQGFWYYADVAVVLAAVILLKMPSLAALSIYWKGAITLLWLVLYVQSARELTTFAASHRWCPQLLAVRGAAITQCLKQRIARPRLLDASDGVFSFYVDLPAAPMSGLTANAASHRVRRDKGAGAYIGWLIRKGYTIHAWSGRCSSGRLRGKVVGSPIKCGKHPDLNFWQLAVPPRKADVQSPAARPAPDR
jgi:hypothetical protein